MVASILVLLEQQGYDVNYAPPGCHSDPDLLTACRVFLSIGHESIDAAMYENVRGVGGRGSRG